MFFHRFSTNLASRSNVISTVPFRAFNFTTLDSADAAPFGTISDALNQLNYTMSRTCPQCEGRIVSTLDTNTRSKEFRRPKPNEQLRKLRPGMWRDEKQAATRMPGSKEAPAQKQGSYAPDGSGHNSQQPATVAKLQLRNKGFPRTKRIPRTSKLILSNPKPILLSSNLVVPLTYQCPLYIIYRALLQGTRTNA